MPPGQVSRGSFRSLVKALFRKSGNDSSESDKDSSRSDASSSGSGRSSSGKSSGDHSESNNSRPSNGNSGSISSSSSSSSHPSSTGTTSPPPPRCILHCVPDNDPRVLYSSSPSWSLSSQGFFQTSHQTDLAGSWLSFNFNGSAITVFGSIPASNATHPPPTAAYAVDAAKPFVTAEPMAAKAILNQPLFSASQLPPGMHKLVVNVTDVQTTSPFCIDYFIVTPSPPQVSASAILPKTTLAVSDASSKTQPSGATVGILAGVLGSALIVLLCLSAFLFVILRRRRQRAHRSRSLQSSLFTTSESILRWNDWGARAPSAYSSTSGPFRTKTRSAAASEKSRSTP
ncbi:hypothetical protein DFH09DRAFT_143017 [Mycena vulgaris]|nr:hypothetical protein DFH09DRAFT_143017 [Mycena vulgaris]